jgi:hypothetical protein
MHLMSASGHIMAAQGAAIPARPPPTQKPQQTTRLGVLAPEQEIQE